MAFQFTSKKQMVETIKAQITTRDNMAITALLRIYKNQTADEIRCGNTYNKNGIGFNETDGEILSSFAKQYNTKGYLTPKQMVILKSKIGKYANQLIQQSISNGVYVKEGKMWVYTGK